MSLSAHGAEGAITNALTIDVEDYFQVSAFAPYIARSEWDQRECRVEHNVQRILELLRQHQTQATFFTLGWIAERYPALVRAIVADGHELASHGYGHERASDLSEQAFADDIGRAKKLLEDLSGKAVLGYRAPSFSIGTGNLWAFDCLAAAGYRYSSSIYPIKHDHYGMPDAPRFAHQVREGLIEVPVTTLRMLDRNLPASGGGYFRLLPYGVSRWMFKRVNAADRQAAVFYFHPWEIDTGQPRIEGLDRKSRFRHYVNIDRNYAKLQRLLGDFSWGRMDQIFLPDQQAGAAVV
ncbi:XrtA system polysaccharide deacetylase [Roseateles toxinivorans]|uniref:Polysaccharide deacetylase family protein (PEP-CTERM system associated) n=1 Tax=Roseateles toxinivorans TaxID=270368 RepID=A0A4R6QUW1_9BURK|nr:XrtA system polysaccharide deacetylase [Roseateles toxinivorans]TDP74605.1 polysaccharide deacetylase family protein (PEP-CTERM system associated) [Roseateles toxinivorans]